MGLLAILVIAALYLLMKVDMAVNFPIPKRGYRVVFHSNGTVTPVEKR